MESAKTNVVMTHTQVNFCVSPRPEIGVGLVSWVSLVSHMVKVRAIFCMLV